MGVKILVLVAALVACASAHGGKKQFGHFRCPTITDQEIMTTITRFVNQESRDELIEFLTAMTTTRGLALLTKFHVPIAMVQDVLTKLKSTSTSDVTQAKVQLQGMLMGLKYAKSNDLQAIFCVYQGEKARHMAIQVVKEATLKDLQCVLNSFSTVQAAVPVQPRHFVRVFAYGIDFAALSTSLNTGGQPALQGVKDKIVAWILTADAAQLDKAGDQYRAAAFTCLTAAGLTTLPPSANVTSAVPRVPAQP